MSKAKRETFPQTGTPESHGLAVGMRVTHARFSFGSYIDQLMSANEAVSVPSATVAESACSTATPERGGTPVARFDQLVLDLHIRQEVP